MVPADDEHKSANEAEKNTSIQKNFVEKLKFWKHCKQEDDKPERLTPMPPCLMKWWIPIALAGLLLIICTPIAFLWGGQIHWPSADGITVCLTIAGAALAFSSWQQRIEDNAIREEERAQAQRINEDERKRREKERNEEQRRYEDERKKREQNRLEQIERDEYWKRREHILHTLDSNNPGIRLAAVSLLAELADSAAHSGLLNHTAQRQLQQHIISTLCLQLRHEGQLLESEGTKEDHIGIQSEILEVIFTRVDPADKKDLLANWSMEVLNFRNVNFYTEFKMINRKTQCTIELTGAVFHENATISGSTINDLMWHKSTFLKQLTFHSQRKENTPGTIVSHDNFPEYISCGEFEGITFCKHESEEGHFHRINVRTSNKENTPDYDDKNYLIFSECIFLHPINTNYQLSNNSIAYLRTEGESTFNETLLPENYTWGTLKIEQPPEDSKNTPERDTDLKFNQCIFEKVYISLGLTHSNTEFTSCYFASQANIAIRTANRSFSFEDLDHIIFEDCIFTMSSDVDTPIKLIHNISDNGGLIPPTFFQLRDNQIHIQKANGQPGFQTLELTGTTIGERYLKIDTIANCIPFEERIPSI